MSSPSTSRVGSAAESIDSASPISQAGEPWLPEPGELPTTPWYEEKASTLRLSDIPIIKDKGGMMGKFEVVIPHPDERAHRPPPGFHTFYMNQIEMGLRFPIPRFIAAFCRHIALSPSQLAPNSYSFLLALAVLLNYHGLPLIPYVLMQLVQIKRLGPGKFYLSHKGDHSFIKGNPSSHKGWMSRFFYAKCDVMRDPWRCEMHWRDSAVTIVPRTPDRAPSLTPFLEAMDGKSYSAPKLIREHLLVLRKARNADVVGHFSFHAAAVVAWGGEMVKRLTKAHQKMNASRDQFDKAMGQHAEVLARLEELETLRSREKEAAEAQREALEAQMLVAKEAHEAEKAAREILEAELEEVKSRAVLDAERLRLEGKEEFLKSPEFDTLLGKKAGGFFKNGFFGCVAQWRANGYPEEEHPATFLNVQQAIAEMPDEEEIPEEEEDEDEEEGGVGSEATSPSSPLS
ncbi:hypothetical protein F511_25856 [Dorcoceras hygrometricum]|uniref:Transposase (Putative), gypsy type n=1 Tax=Dorcoceras hygrometricum TaxID=472368 RepID=A0A2Z7CZC3_9LAMI|nr:hypothetical protein F511_25856 [Dorcoceras hygrometricum]